VVSKRSDIPLERTDDSDQSLWMYSRKDKSLREFGVHLKIPTGAVFSPDGHRVAYPDGRELFYNPGPTVSSPCPSSPSLFFLSVTQYTRHGRFSWSRRAGGYGTPPQINIVTHWFAELRALASATR